MNRVSTGSTRTWQRVVAWGVHWLTASGAVVGVWCLVAIHEGRYRRAFAGMMLAVLIDAVDGPLARVAKVKEALPMFDGSKLDDLIDYLNYVVVPVVFMHSAHLLPLGGSLWILTLPLVASAYRFCHASAKTQDHFFTGFPSYWNILAFYLYAGKTPLWFNATFTVFAAIMVFVPIKYVYPGRTKPLRPLTIGLGILWGVAILIILLQLPNPLPSLVAWSLLYPIYYTVLSFALHWHLLAEGVRTSSRS